MRRRVADLLAFISVVVASCGGASEPARSAATTPSPQVAAATGTQTAHATPAASPAPPAAALACNFSASSPDRKPSIAKMLVACARESCPADQRREACAIACGNTSEQDGRAQPCLALGNLILAAEPKPELFGVVRAFHAACRGGLADGCTKHAAVLAQARARCNPTAPQDCNAYGRYVAGGARTEEERLDANAAFSLACKSGMAQACDSQG